MLQVELHQSLIWNNINSVTKATKMTCTKLVYRGVAYIKDDTGKYTVDTSAVREQLSKKAKPLAAV